MTAIQRWYSWKYVPELRRLVPAYTLRRGGDRQRCDAMRVEIVTPEQRVDILDLNDALERFERRDPEKAHLVKLRYFAGLTIPQAAHALGISATTADRYWAYARAWLHAELSRDR